MANDDDDRQRRIEEMMRENNKKFREHKEQQMKQQVAESFHAQIEKQKLREFARKVQEENLRKTILAKQAKKKKQKEEREKKKRKQERQVKLAEKIEAAKAKELQEQSRVNLTKEQVQQIQRKINDKAAEQLRRMKMVKQVKMLQQLQKKAKLKNLDVRRKNILARTRKVSETTVQPQENMNPNVAIDKKQLLKNLQQKALEEIEVLNSLIEQASGGAVKGKMMKMRLQHSVIEEREGAEEEEEQEEDQDQEEEQEEEQEDEEIENQRELPKFANNINHHDYQEDILSQPQAPTPLMDESFQQLVKTGAKCPQLKEVMDSSSEQEDYNSISRYDQIFKLSSEELMMKAFLRI